MSYWQAVGGMAAGALVTVGVLLLMARWGSGERKVRRRR